MEFIISSLFIYIIVAWFCVARNIHRKDQKQEDIQKLLDDSF